MQLKMILLQKTLTIKLSSSLLTLWEVERDAPITVLHMTIDGQPVPMEIDRGAAKMIIGTFPWPLMAKGTFHKFWPRRSLDKTGVRVQSYLGEHIPVVGSTLVKITYQHQTADLPLIVVNGTLTNKSWLGKIQLNWSQINYTQRPKLHEMLDKYSQVSVTS